MPRLLAFRKTVAGKRIVAAVEFAKLDQLGKASDVVQDIWMKIQTKGPTVSPTRLQNAVAATRPWVLVLSIISFIVGFSLDGVGVMRFPGYIIAGGGVVLAATLGTWLLGRALVIRHRNLDEEVFAAKLNFTKSAGTIMVITFGLAFIVWFMMLTTEVPPWAN